MAEKGNNCTLTSVIPDYNGSDNGTVFCPNCWKPKGTDPQDQDYIPGYVCLCGGELNPVQPLTQGMAGVGLHA